MHSTTCSQLSSAVPLPPLLDCGHASDKYGILDDKKHCYECCAKIDIADMIERGKATLYLTWLDQTAWDAVKVLAPSTPLHRRYTVTNWPGSLKLYPHMVTSSKKGSLTITFVWFLGPDGKKWIGRNAHGHGGFNQLLHCKRLKDRRPRK